MAVPRRQASPNIAWRWIGTTILLLSAMLLFARLGHYAFWDDEAATALHAKGILRTGDTSAILDHNIVATYNGANLRKMCERFEPPLQSYLAAPFLAIFGDNALAGRLPFALSGLATVTVMLWWLRKSRAGASDWILLGCAIIGNVSFMLYNRQCRYYAVATLASVFLAYLYINWDGRRRQLIWFSFFSIILYASNYLSFAAFYVCLGADYLLWGRKEGPLRLVDWLVIAVPQAIAIAILISIWNPLGMDDETHAHPLQEMSHRIVLLWWDFRDMNKCEFGVGILLLAAPLVGILLKDRWLHRGSVTFYLYLITIMLVSPQKIDLKTSLTADIRYLVPLIPLCMFLASRTIVLLGISNGFGAAAIGAVVFGTNLLNGGLFFDWGLRSTLVLYIEELIDPPNDPYTVASNWINNHLKEKETIWVLPGHMTYPLMFHAPKALYAWQLSEPPPEQFAHLDPIHFQFRIPPDYLIAFGPAVQAMVKALQDWERTDISYSLVTVLDQYGMDVHRPELFWRSFKPITNFDRRFQAIYVFQRNPVPPKLK